MLHVSPSAPIWIGAKGPPRLGRGKLACHAARVALRQSGVAIFLMVAVLIYLSPRYILSRECCYFISRGRFGRAMRARSALRVPGAPPGLQKDASACPGCGCAGWSIGLVSMRARETRRWGM